MQIWYIFIFSGSSIWALAMRCTCHSSRFSNIKLWSTSPMVFSWRWKDNFSSHHPCRIEVLLIHLAIKKLPFCHSWGSCRRCLLSFLWICPLFKEVTIWISKQFIFLYFLQILDVNSAAQSSWKTTDRWWLFTLNLTQFNWFLYIFVFKYIGRIGLLCFGGLLE